MAACTPDPDVTGKALFEDPTTFRARDDAADHKDSAGTAYEHEVLEWSATEANEWVGFLQYLVRVVKAGGGALGVRNTSGGTLAAGTLVRINGYNSANSLPTITTADADGAAPAEFVLLTSLANNTNGVAYLGGSVAALNTVGTTIGDPVYLSTTAGAFTFTAPTGDNQITQEVGRVVSVGASGTIQFLLMAPTKIGSSYIRLKLDSLSNVTITGLTTGDTVTWNGTAWVNSPNATTDEKVKADSGDSSAGYLDSKVDNSTIEVSSHALRVKNSGITYAKIQNVSATDKILGRSTAGAGVVEEITCTSTARSILDDTSVGAVRTTIGVGTGDSPTFVGLTLSAPIVGQTQSVTASTAGSGAPNLLAATDSNKVYTNEGSTAQNYHTLPTAVAGLMFTFIVQDADGIRVTANTGDTIRIGNQVSASAGRIDSTTIGSAVILVAINATEWVAISSVGTWTAT